MDVYKNNGDDEYEKVQWHNYILGDVEKIVMWYDTVKGVQCNWDDVKLHDICDRIWENPP